MAGDLLKRATELQNALGLGLTMGLDDMTMDEFSALLAFRDEQGRFEAERAAETSS